MVGFYRRKDGSKNDRSFWEEILGENLSDESSNKPPLMAASTCESTFTYHDFGAARHPWNRCPVIGCTSQLERIKFGRSPKSLPTPCCLEHGIRLQSNSFVYYNGSTKPDNRRARLRSFAFARRFISDYVLDSPKKAETHRLGYESSEDALSWNIFVALMIAGKLREVATWLTGQPVEKNPDLYMWGSLVDLHGGPPPLFDPLKRVREALEPHIRNYFTEPDIMLVVPGELVICIEAKFTSGNPVSTGKKGKAGDKPNSKDGLIACYLDGSEPWAGESQCLLRARIPPEIPSQLFRNVVFGARMAELEGARAQWHVVNLVSSTQWKSRKVSRGYSFEDPTTLMREFLVEDIGSRFSFRTWEDLYVAIVKDDPKLSELRSFIEQKSAHFIRAFELD